MENPVKLRKEEKVRSREFGGLQKHIEKVCVWAAAGGGVVCLCNSILRKPGTFVLRDVCLIT